MGTRSLTMVIDKEGETKVAQYGQWDGYPSDVGACILKFFKNQELVEKLKHKLSVVRFLDQDGVDKEFVENYNKNVSELYGQPDNRTDEQKRWFSNYCSRDLAGDVLFNIANSQDDEIILINREDTAKSDGWVKYSYVINFKENTLGVYEHIDQLPMKVYYLNELPEEGVFIRDLAGE